MMASISVNTLCCHARVQTTNVLSTYIYVYDLWNCVMLICICTDQLVSTDKDSE